MALPLHKYTNCYFFKNLHLTSILQLLEELKKKENCFYKAKREIPYSMT